MFVQGLYLCLHTPVFVFTPVFVCARNAHFGSRRLPFPSVCALPAGSRHKSPHCHPSAPKRVRQTDKQTDICIFAKFPQNWFNETPPADAPHQILNSTTNRLLFLFYRSDPAVQAAILNFDGKKNQFDSNLQFIASITSGLSKGPSRRNGTPKSPFPSWHQNMRK